MKKSIMKCLVLLSCLAVLLTAALSIAGFYSVYEGQVQQQLRTQVEVIRDSLDYSEDPQEYLEAVKLAAGDIRFTWIDADGTVLFDTDAQASQMENHQDRQEVVAARNKGFGQTTNLPPWVTGRITPPICATTAPSSAARSPCAASPTYLSTTCPPLWASWPSWSSSPSLSPA